MANTLTALNVEIWSKDMQRIFFKENVALALANTELRDQLHEGDRVNKPYHSEMKPATYTKGTEVTLQDIGATNEYLEVATAYVVPFYLDKFLSPLWETIVEKLRKLQENLIEAICRQTQKWGASTTIIGEPFAIGVME